MTHNNESEVQHVSKSAFRGHWPSISLAAMLILGALGCIAFIYNRPAPSPTESVLLSVVLTIFSVLGSWLASAVYSTVSARESQQERIDHMGRLASEKIWNLSTQLWRLEASIGVTSQQADQAGDAQEAANLLHTGLRSIELHLQNLRSLNNSLANDWTGVVSSEERLKIEDRFESLARLINKYSELEDTLRLEGPPQTASDAERFKDLSRQLRELEQRTAGIAPLPGSIKVQGAAQAVRVDQEIHSTASNRKQSGHLIVEILRPVYMATGTGKLTPNTISPPKVFVDLRGQPDGTPELILGAGAGTTYDFNVHLKSNEWGKMLPVGKYRFSYNAVVPRPTGTRSGEDRGDGISTVAVGASPTRLMSDSAILADVLPSSAAADLHQEPDRDIDHHSVLATPVGRTKPDAAKTASVEPNGPGNKERATRVDFPAEHEVCLPLTIGLRSSRSSGTFSIYLPDYVVAALPHHFSVQAKSVENPAEIVHVSVKRHDNGRISLHLVPTSPNKALPSREYAITVCSPGDT